MTGHWPVVKDSDLAQPVPSDNDSEPTLAASSMPPGSPVTYRPGMPTAPPAAVTSISEFSTVAGASPRIRAAVPAGLETDRVHGRVDLGYAEDLLDLVLGVALGHVDGLAAELAGPGRPGLVSGRPDG